MERVPMSTFVEYLFAVGPKRYAVARSFKDHRYDHLADFYKPLRAAIVAMHVEGQQVDKLDELVATIEDERKRRIFPAAVEGYKRWLATGRMTWISPPETVLSVGELEISVKPELGMEIDGRPHLIAMYFEAVPLAPRRADAIRSLMSAAFGSSKPGFRVGVLDVTRGKLLTSEKLANPRLGLVARAEAASFSTIYAAI